MELQGRGGRRPAYAPRRSWPAARPVYWEIQSGDSGRWQVADSGTTHDDNTVVSCYADLELPCYLRLYAKVGTQERLTQPARNYNCAG